MIKASNYLRVAGLYFFRLEFLLARGVVPMVVKKVVLH